MNEILFTQKALQLFRYQFTHNLLYQTYCKNIGTEVEKISTLTQIPFLPIAFFKSNPIQTGNFHPEIIFQSSSTTSETPAKHFVKNTKKYEDSFVNAFEYFYGNASLYCFLCLLPSYLERQGSSLVFMANHFIKTSQYAESGFFLNNLQTLASQLKKNIDSNIPTILLGVSFALLDFANQFPIPLKNVIVMETGGMKGRKEEISREDLHTILKNQFQTETIHSEYGMTELLSQAYSKADGVFASHPSQMKIFIRPLDSPTSTQSKGCGGLNIIDLNNVDSCAFIATEDLGEVFEDGTFKIHGRIQNAPIRGCHQLIN